MDDKFELLYDKIRMRIGSVKVGMIDLGETDHLRGRLMELEELKAYADKLRASQKTSTSDEALPIGGVGGSLQSVKELIENSAKQYIDTYKPPHGVIAGAIEKAYIKGAIDMHKHLTQ